MRNAFHEETLSPVECIQTRNRELKQGRFAKLVAQNRLVGCE